MSLEELVTTVQQRLFESDEILLTAGGSAYFWVRALVVDGGNSSSNPYVCDVALEGTALSAAGWED